VALATNVAISEDELVVSLADGRTITVPIEWFPRLRDASPESRQNWRIIGGGIGIRWEDIDEDLHVPSLLVA